MTVYLDFKEVMANFISGARPKDLVCLISSEDTLLHVTMHNAAVSDSRELQTGDPY